MILEPSKTAEEIDRRLSALTDPELAKVLQTLNRELAGEDDADSYVSPSAPYWKRRIGLLALAGLLALSVGYGYTGASRSSHANVRPKAAAALPAPAPRHRTVATRRNKAKHTAAVTHLPAVLRHAPAPVVVAPAPNEALIRQARAQLLHQRVLAEQARAQAALAQHQAQVAIQERATAQHQALEEALAQARAEALAQARAEALARAQAESAASERAQEWAVQNASGSGTKPGSPMPPGTGHMATYPNPNAPPPGPGPMDPNCTPHRGSLFQTALTGVVLNHVRVGGTSVGNLLQLVHP